LCSAGPEKVQRLKANEWFYWWYCSALYSIWTGVGTVGYNIGVSSNRHDVSSNRRDASSAMD
jgi:predicted branched-subunit amino acid permease